jgi:hypothetical protein
MVTSLTFSLDFRMDRLECITMIEIRRLIHLLSYDKEWVAGRAALAIGKIVDGHYILRDIDYQLIASCGVRPLICLLSSSNLDVVRTATRTIGLIFSDEGHVFSHSTRISFPPLLTAMPC